MFQSVPLHQDWTQPLPKYWNDNSPFKTHFLNALSLTLPECEKFFIETLKYYSKDVNDPNLSKDIKEFVKQESQHRHSHRKYNNWLASQGLPIDRLQSDTNFMWNQVRNKINRRSHLALTICVEHITVVYASVFMTHPELLETMHPQFEHIWRWHAIEELEHKAVAMDVWYSTEDDNFYKNLAMFFVLPMYMWYVGKNTLVLLNADKQLWKWNTVKDMCSFLFNKRTGLLTKSFIPWLDFLKKDFHPNDQNHSSILVDYSKV
jgi:predicted metal-dependent hydrolase